MASIVSFATANRACALLYSYIKEHNDGTYLLPVNVCPVVPLTFFAAGVPFEFVDIDDTLCISQSQCIDKIKSDDGKYNGIVYVRTYGALFDVENFFSDLRRLSPFINIIDDRCLCLPDFNTQLGNADMVLYSTGCAKQIELKHGGIAFYSKLESYTIDYDLIYYETDEELIYKEAYANNKTLPQIPTGWLKLDHCNWTYDEYKRIIESRIEERKDICKSLNKVYTSLLPSAIIFPEEYQGWRFNIRVPMHLKEKILQELFINKLFASSHYHSANRLFDNEIYPSSQLLYASVINLFNDYHYSIKKAELTCKIINKFIK